MKKNALVVTCLLVLAVTGCQISDKHTFVSKEVAYTGSDFDIAIDGEGFFQIDLGMV